MTKSLYAAACICMAAAICEQIMDTSRYFPAVRLVLGLQIAAAAAALLLKCAKILNI